MMPGPAPVNDHETGARHFALKSAASRYSALSGLVRAEPKMETFRLPA